MKRTIVTKAGVERLEAERPKPTLAVEYTIGGTEEAHVHQQVETARKRAIADMRKTLSSKGKQFRHDVPAAALKGYAQATFTQTTDARAAYVSAQRAKLEHARKQMRVRPSPNQAKRIEP